MWQIPEQWHTWRGELLTGSRTSPQEVSVLQSTKMKGVGKHKGALTSDMEMQSLEFAQMVFSLVSIQYFLTLLVPPTFGMVYRMSL